MKKSEHKVCANCKHWKNEQAELEYTTIHGICACPKWKFDTAGEAEVSILDRGNLSGKHMNVHRVESISNVIPYGAPLRSRYCLVTEEKFGCIHFIKK